MLTWEMPALRERDYIVHVFCVYNYGIYLHWINYCESISTVNLTATSYNKVIICTRIDKRTL